jgi:hypothetical protein
MNKGAPQNDAVELVRLANKLAKCPEVTAHDTLEEKQAWTMAHAFIDLRESFRIYLDEQLPRLLNDDLTPQEIHDLLLDMGEEFRHVLYHINDPEFYKRLLGPLQKS